jgi:hypothetical protein
MHARWRENSHPCGSAKVPYPTREERTGERSLADMQKTAPTDLRITWPPILCQKCGMKYEPFSTTSWGTRTSFWRNSVTQRDGELHAVFGELRETS